MMTQAVGTKRGVKAEEGKFSRELSQGRFSQPLVDLSRFLVRENFPRTLEDGQAMLSRATLHLMGAMQKMTEIPAWKKTFGNTVMEYHTQMTVFDSIERLIRSERLIHDETPGKAELLQECLRVKDQIFSDPRISGMFLSFAEKMPEERLSPLEWQYLKGVIHSMKGDAVPSALLGQLYRVRHVIDRWQGTPFASLMGQAEPKMLTGKKKEFSFLSANLCMMTETTTMICGGVVPWPARIDALAEELRRLDPDMFFLQEVYDVQAIFELHRRLAPSYVHFYGNAPATLFGLSHESLLPASGLAVISKLPLENMRFEPFKIMTNRRSSGFDRLNLFGFDRNYGIFHCDVTNGKEILAHVATTHENPFYADVREQQTQQIMELFAKEAAKDPTVPWILCGDLNIERGDLNEGGERLLRQHFMDHYQGDGPTWFDFGNFWFHKWHADPERYLNRNPQDWTVDRSLLWLPWASQHPYTMRVERVPFHDGNPVSALTDHHGIMTHFAWET